MRDLRRRSTVRMFCAAGAGLALAAYGFATSASAGSGPAGPARTASVPSAVTKALATADAVPRFTSPGSPFNARVDKGKTIFVIPTTSTNPFNASIYTGMQQAAALVGIHLINYSNQGQVSQWAAGINQAIAQHADLILLLSAPFPDELQPQLKKARAAHIPVLVTNFYPEGSAVPANVTALVRAPMFTVGRLMADQAIAESGGTADVMIVTDRSAVPAAPAVEAGIRQELKAQCPKCRVGDLVNVPFLNAATQMPTAVSAGLTKNPDIHYIIPVFDAFVQDVLPGVNVAHAQSKVRIISFNGQPAVLSQIASKVVDSDAGQDLTWVGWGDMDQAMRILAGLKPLPGMADVAPLRMWTAANIKQTGNPPKSGVGYGTAYVAGYKKLWKLG